MENASKALLIAAAVLIVILLIAFGVRIFNSSTNVGDPDGAANSIKQGISQGTTSLNAAIQSVMN